MRASFNRFQMVSYLDLMCCGFGGALLLFLIAASAAPPPSTENQLVVIRCRHVSGVRAEVGLEYQPPGGLEWVRPTRGSQRPGTVTFSARSHPASGADSVLIMTAPAAGRWKVRPYLIDFPSPAAGMMDGAPGQPPGLTVTIDAMGRGVTLESDESHVSKLLHPGDTGNTVVLVVDAGVPRQR